MKLRTLALALALACGLTAVGEAKQRPVVRRSFKPSKVKKFKAGKYKARKQVIRKRVRR